jgi:ureidoacrylate peracid hydrolase
MPQALTIAAKPAPMDLDPTSTAILVVDMQNDFGSHGGMFERAGVPIAGIQAIVPNVAGVLDAGRRAGLPIVYIKMGYLPDLSNLGREDAPNRVRHLQFGVGQSVSAQGRDWRILIRDGWGTEVVDALKPAPGDLQVWKHRYSAFFDTELDAALRARAIRSLVITGCTTSVCVESTVRDAFFRDYRCLMLTDCMAEPIAGDMPRTNHDASVLMFEMMFGWTCGSGAFINAVSERLSVDALHV